MFLWLAVAVVSVSLIAAIAAFRFGVERGFRHHRQRELGAAFFFGAGTATAQMDHGGYGYALSTVIETIRSHGGLTDDAKILAPFGVEFPDNFTRSGTDQRGYRQGGGVPADTGTDRLEFPSCINPCVYLDYGISWHRASDTRRVPELWSETAPPGL